tara:strand:+ start:877 stop:1110 length:234 start_codon:yes stop_codon:yes gene_type:complete
VKGVSQATVVVVVDVAVGAVVAVVVGAVVFEATGAVAVAAFVPRDPELQPVARRRLRRSVDPKVRLMRLIRRSLLYP